MAGASARAWASVLLGCLALACGKRGDPLPPLRRNPEPIASLQLLQRGDSVELAFVAPTRSIDGLQLPVLDVEVLVSSEVGDLEELAEPIPLKAAPGERLVHTLELPEPGTPLRFAVRTIGDGKRSALSPESLLVAQAPPPPPSDVSVRLAADGLSLTWTECVPTTPDPPLPGATEALPGDASQHGEDAAEGSAETGTGSEVHEDLAEGVDAAAPGTDESAGQEAPLGAAAGEPAPRADAEPPSGAAALPEAEPPAGTESPGDPELAPPSSPQGEAPGADAADPDGPDAGAGSGEPETTEAPPEPAVAPSTGVRLFRRLAEGEYREPLVASALASEAHLDAGLEHGVEYCYQLRTVLRAEIAVEGAASEEVCATFLDQTPPPAPQGLSALRREATVDLAWSPRPAGAELPAALRVYRRVNDGAPELVAELEPGVNRWSDTEAPRDAVLEYTLTATDAVGNESEPSRHARLIPE